MILKILSRIFYNKSKFLNQQDLFFKKWNIDRKIGIEHLELLKSKYKNLKKLNPSEHSVFFCALSKSKYKINKILEIGTFNANNVFLLSKLFPEAFITTLDLPDNEQTFLKEHPNPNEFIQERNDILKDCKNVKFVKMNSIMLLKEKNMKNFDLIWVDGDHDEPTVSIDIINSFNLTNKFGFILCDDIRIKKSSNFTNSGFFTIQCLGLQKLIEHNLIYKYVTPTRNLFSFKRKYIAIIQKLIDNN